MSEQFIDGLFVSSMIFFNILCILGIITSFVIMWAIFSLKKHTQSTLESIKNTTDNIGSISADIAQSFAPLFKPRKSWVDVALELIRNR